MFFIYFHISVSFSQFVDSIKRQTVVIMGRGGIQVVGVLAFCSDDPSSNPTGADSYSVKFCL